MHLAVVFTRGVSVDTWDQVGMLKREVALYERLGEHGVRVSFVTYGDGDDLCYAKHMPGIRILCNHWGLPQKVYEILLPFLHGTHLRHVDVYKTNQTQGAEVALRAARLFRKPLIARCGYLLSRFAILREGESSKAVQYARKVEREVFTGAEQIVVTAGHMKQYVEREYGLRDDKVAVIPNYVLTDIFRPNPQIACRPGRVCFAGRLSPQKNLMALLEAVRSMDIELEIIGDGPQREKLEAAARDKGVQARFLGSRPHKELPELFNGAEAVILPSLYEGHPKVLLEAMACGRSVIGANVVGIREIIEHRVNGYLCGTSPQEIGSAIRDVLDDQELRTHMGRKARQFVMEHFSLETVVQTELATLKIVRQSAAHRSWLARAVEALVVMRVVLAQLGREMWFLVGRLMHRVCEMRAEAADDA